MSLGKIMRQTFRRSFPRVSGDEPIGDSGALAGARFSPRERG